MKILNNENQIADSNPETYIIAEAGVNHNGDMALARQLVDVAVNAGANAIKFQTFKAEKVVTADASKAYYQQQTTDSSESQLAMLKRLELAYSDFHELYEYSIIQGIDFISTPFDYDSVDFLDQLGVNVFKIPSGEITNLSFLAYIAQKQKPMIVSTGMSTLGEVESAVQTIEENGNKQLTLLHCVSNYPADPADVNLRAMATIAQAFGYPVGYSDHTMGIEVALAAVSMGACMIEKHFTLDRELPGPDHKASLEPSELTQMVQSIRVIESAMGHGRKEPTLSEANSRLAGRRSITTSTDLNKGTILTQDMLVMRRPGTGLPLSMLPYVIGKELCVDVTSDMLLQLDMFE